MYRLTDYDKWCILLKEGAIGSVNQFIFLNHKQVLAKQVLERVNLYTSTQVNQWQ